MAGPGYGLLPNDSKHALFIEAPQIRAERPSLANKRILLKDDEKALALACPIPSVAPPTIKRRGTAAGESWTSRQAILRAIRSDDQNRRCEFTPLASEGGKPGNRTLRVRTKAGRFGEQFR